MKKEKEQLKLFKESAPECPALTLEDLDELIKTTECNPVQPGRQFATLYFVPYSPEKMMDENISVVFGVAYYDKEMKEIYGPAKIDKQSGVFTATINNDLGKL